MTLLHMTTQAEVATRQVVLLRLQGVVTGKAPYLPIYEHHITAQFVETPEFSACIGIAAVMHSDRVIPPQGFRTVPVLAVVFEADKVHPGIDAVVA